MLKLTAPHCSSPCLLLALWLSRQGKISMSDRKMYGFHICIFTEALQPLTVQPEDINIPDPHAESYLPRLWFQPFARSPFQKGRWCGSCGGSHWWPSAWGFEGGFQPIEHLIGRLHESHLDASHSNEACPEGSSPQQVGRVIWWHQYYLKVIADSGLASVAAVFLKSGLCHWMMNRQCLCSVSNMYHVRSGITHQV